MSCMQTQREGGTAWSCAAPSVACSDVSPFPDTLHPRGAVRLVRTAPRFTLGHFRRESKFFPRGWGVIEEPGGGGAHKGRERIKIRAERGADGVWYMAWRQSGSES